jgi:dihydrofolate reductase
MNNVNIIVAVDDAGGFGKDGKIPWHFPEDFKRFKEITKDSVCVMGRNTYEDMLEMVKSRKKDPNVKIETILP